ncbi:GNAT family N-acetyltransferase [Oxalobacteraceae bacterium OM1]|nr:GNAT family N-acetyltransferase [Oxalobacteraceae bacterium OM1]
MDARTMPEIIESEQRWHRVLASFDRFECFHTWEYTMLEAGRYRGRGFAFHMQEGSRALFLPVIERGIPGHDLKDLTSAYGYPGPLYRGETAGFAPLWQAAMQQLRQMGYVSLFSRCSPVFTRHLQPMPEFQRTHGIVVVDLKLSEEEQRRRYRDNHIRGIKRASGAGLTIERGALRHIGDFLRLYYATMDRVGASSEYYFSESYIRALMQASEFETRLYLCRLGERIVAAGLFLYCGDIVQYHLGGSDTEHLQLGSMKLLLDAVRRAAADEHYSSLVLGGSHKPDDQLFHFKVGFSKNIVDFYLIKRVLDDDLYDALCRERNVDPASMSGFFPPYRAYPAGNTNINIAETL